MQRTHYGVSAMTPMTESYPAVLVEQPASDQLALHLAKLLTDLLSRGSICPTLLKLVLGELPMAKVRRRDPRSIRFGLCASTDPAM